MQGYHDNFLARRPSARETRAQRESMGQGPLINAAQETADGAQETANDALGFVPVGGMMEYAGAAAPPDPRWMPCDGRVLEGAAYPALFAALGTTWNTGGEGAGQFRVPDRRGRVAVGAGQGSGLTNRVLASRFGAETHTLLETEIASHNHGGTQPIGYAGRHNHALVMENFGMSGNFGSGRQVYSPDNWPDPQRTEFVEAVGDHTHPFNLPFNGGDKPHNNMQPSLAINYIIRVL